MAGINADNYGNQLDYHAGTGQLAAVTDTIDNIFAGSSTIFTNYRGVVSMFKEPSMDIVWMKTVSYPSYI